MKKKVDLISKHTIFHKAIFTVEEAHLRHERYDGSMSDEIVRLNLARGDAVAAVVHNIADNTLLFTEQFRYPTYEKGPGWLLELPAGMIDAGEDPQTTLQRELVEEIGYTAQVIKPIGTFYLSPGGTSERIYLYYVRVTPQDKTAAGGGLTDENEDIRTVALPVAAALKRLAAAEIHDAKTIIGLQWVQMNRFNLH